MKHGFTILCVEDERVILDNNRKAFEDEGYTVLTAETIAEAKVRLKGETIDAMVLDIMLPDGLGLDLLKELRAQGNQIPVLLLTAWGKPSDIAGGLKAGANDYVCKPFEYVVLLARVEAMLRNIYRIPETITKGAITLNLSAMQAYAGDTDLLLSPKEFTLLLVLLQNSGRIVEVEYAYETIYCRPMGGENSAFKTLVSRLREKISPYGADIIAIRGKGYQLDI